MAHNQRLGEEGLPARLPIWGGVECTVNRVEEGYVDQFERSGHHLRLTDLDRIVALGIDTLRHSVVWERVCPNRSDEFLWGDSDRSLERIRELGAKPIVGLVHHGSGPHYTSLLDPEFPEKLARYARAVAERYPWVDMWTPVNEPLTTARFSAMYGLWYPHHRDPGSFATALMNQIRGTILAMREIRAVNPRARLVQTEDLGKTHATSRLSYQAEYENERRWLSWDLLCGHVGQSHLVVPELLRHGVDESALRWFEDNPCPPDLLGVNHYITSERFLDHRLERYPSHTHGGNGKEPYADIEAVRVLAGGCAGPGALLTEAWERFGIPIAITECHLGCSREEQARWLLYVYGEAEAARERGAQIEALTVWSLLGAFDWNSLLCRSEGCYESGVFDLRAPEPRPTMLASVVYGLANGELPNHPALQMPGWWERPLRLIYPPVISNVHTGPQTDDRGAQNGVPPQPLLITGATGTLGSAFVRLCELRGIDYRATGRGELDLASLSGIERWLDEHRPWAVINAAGYVRVDDAEWDTAACFRDNVLGPTLLAEACARRGIQLVTFSSDLVFGGQQDTPFLETDEPNPLGAYGRSKLEAELRVAKIHPKSLIVRTSAFFGPWDEFNFLHRTLDTLSRGGIVEAAVDQVVSPTYVPDLANACLDLLLDGESGLWHLANDGVVSWAEFAMWGACIAGADASRIRLTTDVTTFAPRPRYSALASERGWIMPSLEDALARWATESKALRDADVGVYLA